MKFNLTTEKIQNIITRWIKIFFIGMVRQFLAHTILTYGINIPSFLSPIRAWKEIFIIIGIWLIIWNFIIDKDYRKKIWWNKYIIAIGIIILISMVISLCTSLFIHNQWIKDFIVSAKYNYTPLIIFLVGVCSSYLLNKEQNSSILTTAITTIKRVLVFSLFRYGLLHTIPNILDRIGFAQPGTSIERVVWNPPPSLWLTEFYTGYVRNQWPFSGPLSLWFYLAAMRPFFFAFVLYKKRLSDTRWWWLIYISIVMSSYSRAAWWMFLITLLGTLLIVYRKYSKYMLFACGWAILLIIIYLLWWGKSELFMRTRSDQWHIEFFLEWLRLVKQNRLRWIGSASVGPWANYSDVHEVFNPENQYMQIWLEYGLFWMLSRVFSYIFISYQSIIVRIKKWLGKFGYINNETIAYSGISLSIVALSIAGMVLHPFVDSTVMYPLMMIIGLLFGIYYQQDKPNLISLYKEKIFTRKEKRANIQQQKTYHTIDFYDHHISPVLTNPNTNTNNMIWFFNSIRMKLFSNTFHYFLLIFTIIIAFFFILQTFFVFGIPHLWTSTLRSLIRDGLFRLIIFFSIILNIPKLWNFIKSFWFIIIPIVIVALINIFNLLQYNGSGIEIIAGIKYDISYILILWAGLWIGYIIFIKKQWEQLKKYLQRFFYFSFFLIIWWVLWQILKNITPNIFLNYLGYSSPSDFIPYTNPPIYYLTGSNWMQRLSGFFVGPNTLWFFLISLTSIFAYILQKSIYKKYIKLCWILYFIITLFTFSRWAIIGVSIQLLFLTLLFNIESTWFKAIINTIQKKRINLTLIIIWSLWSLWFVNQRKDGSNIERFSYQTEIQQIIHTIPPLWYWPGYIWPARHYVNNYIVDQKNSFSLVENIYLQTIVNQWRIWLLLLLTIIWGIFSIHYTIWKRSYNKNKENLLSIIHYLWFGLISLLSIGFFLHIFIDTMVNYLILFPYGILLAYTYGIINNKHII